MNKKIINGVKFIQKSILANKSGQILALKRTIGDDFRSGCWDLPGGTYEQGEDIIESIAREIKEEVGITAITLRPIYLASGLKFANQLMYGETVFSACHLCTEWKGEVVISDEHSEFRWVTPQELTSYNFGDDGGFFVASIKAYLTLSKIKKHSAHQAR